MARKLPNPMPATAASTRQRMALIFNEWARRYAEDPDSFGSILDADGKPISDYGEQCAAYFEQIADDLDATK